MNKVLRPEDLGLTPPDPAKQAAWENFVKSQIVHKGHGNNGQGSAISKAVHDHWSKVNARIFKEDLTESE